MTAAPTKQGNAFDIPTKTFALQLQRNRSSAHAPKASQYFQVTKPRDPSHTQRISKAAI
ncbi:hypothetical protein [Comamonas aquatica]|uniref:hypothetical protein n=1 Tax=Comamonas aquatica TaxID=225991 RepID=UPI0024487613|nr:hypothetical protein [Comamonas aquatica]MDH0493361.1 hypothetical protein [Comamonas aquatica]